MTNKYLEKIAAAMDQGDKDSLKTFGRASTLGYAGHVAGLALGATALGSRRGRGLVAAVRRSNVGQMARKGIRAVKNSGAGQRVGKFFGHKVGPAAVGGVIGGLIGEEAATYGAIRHGIKDTRKNKEQGN